MTRSTTWRMVLAGCALFWGTVAYAAAPPNPAPVSVCNIGCQVSIAATSTSGRVALPFPPATYPTQIAITLRNKSTVDIHYRTGSSTVNALTTDTTIAAGDTITVWTADPYVAAITSGSDAGTLLVYQANGPLALKSSASGGGGGSGTVTSVATGTGLIGGPITTTGTLVLKPAAASEIGGVNSSAAVTHNFLTAISTAGAISRAQPACADISDAGTGCSGAASATGANPTATIGASAVNGSSLNFMRADAAPPLPATLPALNGSLLTALSGGNITAGSVANVALANSSVTINGTSVALGASGTVTAAAGTLTGTTLAAGVTVSSLTSVGTLTGGATGAGFTVALSTSTITGSLADARLSANVALYNGVLPFTTMQVVNVNGGSTPTPLTGAILQLVGANASNSFIEQDVFGGNGIFTCRRANGTLASPTNILANDVLCGFSGRGYGATGYSSASRASVQNVALENWSDTVQGAGVIFNCTAVTTVTTAECGRVTSTGFQGALGATTPSTIAATTGAFSTTLTVTSANAAALAVGLAGATNPAFSVDASTGSQVAGLKVTGAATGGTVALAVIDSGSNANISINAKGSGTVSINGTGTGAITLGRATNVAAGLFSVTGVDATFGGASATNGFAVNNYRAGLNLGGVMTINFSPAANGPTTSPTTIISQQAAGVVQIGTTSANAAGSLAATGATLSGSSVVLSGLGASSSGSKALCMNGTTVTVSSTNVCPV